MDARQLTDRFRDYLVLELNRSRNTSEAYCRDISQFIDWSTGNKQDFTPDGVTSSDVRSWLGGLAPLLSAASLRRKAQSLRAFYHWMMKTGIAPSNPAADIVLAKLPKRLPSFVRENEIEEILEETERRPADEEGATQKEDFFNAREHIILLILYSTGIRQEELRTLRDTDVDFSLREIKVLGKRSKQRVIPIADTLMEEIRRWQRLRNCEFGSLSSDAPLIPGHNGRPISKSTLYNIVKKALASTSASKKSPHVLRHTFATSMLNAGSNLDSVKEFLGHNSIATTQIYTHLSFAELRRNYSGAHPRSAEKKKEK